jgi:glycogen operon protein
MTLLDKKASEAARASFADPITQQEFDICSPSIGVSAPLGAAVRPSVVNFSLFSRKASRVELMLCDREDQARPTQVINIDPTTNRTYHYWHVFVKDIKQGQTMPTGLTYQWIPQMGCTLIATKCFSTPMAET